MRLTQDSLRTLAESTGGFAAVDTNSFAEAFNRIIDANSRYYLLGYAPPTHPRDGRFHRIEVRSKRPGLTRSRGAATRRLRGKTAAERKQDASSAGRETVAAAARTTHRPSCAPRSTARCSSRASRSRCRPSPFKGTAKEASVALTVELRGRALELAPQANGCSRTRSSSRFSRSNEDGRAQRGTRAALNLAVRPDTYQRVKALGVRLNSRTAMAAGRYQLRWAPAIPTAGRPAPCSTTSWCPISAETR